MLGDDAEAEGTQHVVNQVWLERIPTDPRDMIGHLVIVDHPQGKIGAAGRSSQWRHMIEVFMWKLDGHRLGLFSPQDKQRAKVRVKTYDCEGDAPEPFEICMDIEADDRKVTYYSRREWEIEPHNVADSLEDFAETYPNVARAIATELDGAPVVTDVDTSGWSETAGLPWK